jgi:hypothetical protein
VKTTVEDLTGKTVKTFPMFFSPALPSQIVDELKGMHVRLDRMPTTTATTTTLHHGDVRTAVRADNGDIWCYVIFASGVSCNIELGELDTCDCRG